MLINEPDSGVFLFERPLRGRQVLVQVWAMMDYWSSGCDWDASELPDPPDQCVVAAQFWWVDDQGEESLLTPSDSLLRVFGGPGFVDKDEGLFEFGQHFYGGSGLTLLKAFPDHTPRILAEAVVARDRRKKALFERVFKQLQDAKGREVWIRTDAEHRADQAVVGRVDSVSKGNVYLDKARAPNGSKKFTSIRLHNVTAVSVTPVRRGLRRQPDELEWWRFLRATDDHSLRPAQLRGARCQQCRKIVVLPWRSRCPHCRAREPNDVRS